MSVQKEINLQSEVIAELTWDDRVDVRNIDVEVDEGDVTLTGTVPTYSQKHAAELDAWIISGVRSVDNRIKIEFPEDFEVPSDSQIRANVEASLMSNSLVDSTKITVKVAAGVVNLEGTQETYYEKAKAEDIALDVRGVIDVRNQITVVPSESLTDEAIGDTIISRLRRSAFVNAENVNVTVQNGIVSLSGKVDGWSAYKIALDSARFTTGVIDVIDNLRIEV